ncbi:SPX domain-containing protein [Yarrowia lipolytica]|uniref:SPX domain-domain-containing protein n=1 Tax=Yarrowia lipolytica TaxID=4952 RepID=A0A371CF55_YARLL|nr:SPX domain-containing protein [Yarrowia lipolytica]KAE8171922.1 SPX domain-containing protein [Yarrowia lipolytica]RDW28913.1 SPX domain-domain-containing protein [Yarrowia lipolytica]RMJ00505.1 SPX domain-containing protein [Yarrowia lipolytica]
MKFTELLAEYQVPEWKSQYVDYKWGKKLLKKIPDDLKDRLKRHNTFNDEIDAPSEPQNIAAQQQAVLVDQTAGEASISPKTVAPAAAAATSPNTGITPGALLGEPSETEPFNSGSENDNYGATESREGSVEDHERHDPQSGGVASHDPNLSPSYMSRERLSRGQSGHPTPILLSKISTSGGDSVKLPPAALEGGTTPEMAPHRGIITRGKSSSGRADSVKAKFHIGTPKITPEVNTNYSVMDNSFSVIAPYDSEKDFIAWLDSQLDKVNEFYDQKMNETHERYRILVGQLVRLQRQKLHLRQRPNKPAREGLSVVERQIELPSLPSFAWLKKSDSNDVCDLDAENTRASSESALRGQNPHFHDATTDHEGISYASARRQLKTAMQEYYRSIELLRSYCTLNRTAFRKILKKYDKISGRHMSAYYMDLVDHTDFCNVENSRLDIVAAKVEDLYTNNFERGNRKHAISKLRSTGLTYKVKWPYYTAMVVDLVLRFNWIWYAIFEQQIQQKQLLSFFVALSEIFRRVMWMFFRMENEHVSNVKRFRASRDVPLPYHVHVCAEPGETDETAVEEGHQADDEDEDEARDRMGSSTGVEWARESPGVSRDSPRKSRVTDSPLRKRGSHVEEGNTPSLRATATPVMEAISNMVQKAHTADFQRRKKPQDDQGKDSDGEDDDDDEDDDE